MEEFTVDNIHPNGSQEEKAIHVIAEVFDRFDLTKRQEHNIAEWVNSVYGESN